MLHSTPRGRPRKKTDRLAPSEYVHLAPTAVHTRVRLNHENCPAGTDRRKRLEIRNNGARILAYCHHCGRSGSQRIKLRCAVGPTTPPVEVLRIPPRVRKKGEWDALDKLHLDIYLNRYELSHKDLSNLVGYDYDTMSVYVGNVVKSSVNEGGYQVRYIGSDPDRKKGPKYLTYGKTSVYLVWSSREHGNASFVVVEDWISAHKVSKAGHHALLTYGSNPTDAQVGRITAFAKALPGVPVLVFYDDDNTIVRKHSIELVQKLQATLGQDRVSNIAAGNDPKNIAMPNLQLILKNRTKYHQDLMDKKEI